MKNMAFKRVGTILVLVHNEHAPDDASWSAYQEAMNGKKLPVAVVSSSPIVRGIVGVLRWFGITIRSFTPHETEQAFRYAGIRPDEIPEVWLAARLLQRELAGGALKSIRQQ